MVKFERITHHRIFSMTTDMLSPIPMRYCEALIFLMNYPSLVHKNCLVYMTIGATFMFQKPFPVSITHKKEYIFCVDITFNLRSIAITRFLRWPP